MGQAVLGQYSYRRAGGLVPSVGLLNVFYERAPTNLKDQVALLTRPTLTGLATVGAGPIRAVFWDAGAFDGDALVVSGTSLYRVNASAQATFLGNVPGSGIVEIAASKTMALIANVGPLLQTDGATVTAMDFPDDQDVKSVGYINGYFLAVPASSHRMYFTDLLTGEFDGTRFISAERYPDNLEKIVVTSDEVWAMGGGSVEVFVPTGIDTSEQPPFQRVEGRLYKKGLVNAATAVEADNSVFWVGTSKDSGPAVYRGDSVPIAVNDACVAERVAKADPATMTAWAFGQNGKAFYVLGLGDQGTWALDIGERAWNEWGSIGRDQWRAHLGRGVWNGKAMAGDIETGRLYLLDDGGVDDDGSVIMQRVAAGVPVDGRPTNGSVSLDCAVGQAAMGEEVLINMEVSDDQGRTWQDEGRCSLGETGEYLTRARWDRCGMMVPPMRIYEFTTTSRVRMRVSGVRLNEPY